VVAEDLAADQEVSVAEVEVGAEVEVEEATVLLAKERIKTGINAGIKTINR
jgi:hypothetical protein